MYFHPHNIIVATILLLGIAVIWHRRFSYKNRSPSLINYGLLALLISIIVPNIMTPDYGGIILVITGFTMLDWLRSIEHFSDVEPPMIGATIAAGIVAGLGIYDLAGRLFSESALVSGTIGIIVLVLLFSDVFRNIKAPTIDPARSVE